MHGKWPLAVGLAAVIVLGAAGYGWWWREQHKPVPAPKQAAKPAPQPVELTLAGKVQAKNVVDVAAPVGGVLDQFLVNVGEEVFEGEVLARIKNTGLQAADQAARTDSERAQKQVTDLEAELIAARLEVARSRSDAVHAKSEFERTQKEYQRQKMLYELDATPRLTYERAERDYQTAKADYEGLQGTTQAAEDRVEDLTKQIEVAKAIVLSKGKDLDNMEAQMAGGEVRSPVNGVMVARRGAAGDPVDEGTKDLLQVAVDLTALQVIAEADPRTLQQIHPGQQATIQIAEA